MDKVQEGRKPNAIRGRMNTGETEKERVREGEGMTKRKGGKHRERERGGEGGGREGLIETEAERGRK